MRTGLIAIVGVIALHGCSETKPAVRADGPAKAPAKQEVAAKPTPAQAPAEDPPAAAKAPAEEAPTERAAVEPADDPAGNAGVATSPWAADVEVVIRRSGGERLRIAAAHQGATSLLWAQPLSTTTTPAEPATKLRVTSGEVLSIAADVSGDRVWVAWRSSLDDGDSQITALAGFDAALAKVHQPRILRTIADPPVADANLVVRGRGGDGRVAVAALIGTRPCKGIHAEGEGSCRGMQVDLVAADGTTERSAQRWLDGGDGGLDALVDVGTGVVSSFHVWHGGPLMDVVMVPANPAMPVRTLPTCDYPPIEPVVAGGSILMLCPDPGASDSERSGPKLGCTATAEGENCGFIARTDFTGAPVAPSSAASLTVALRTVAKRCDGSKGTVRLGWDGGGIDVPGAPFDVRCP